MFHLQRYRSFWYSGCGIRTKRSRSIGERDAVVCPWSKMQLLNTLVRHWGRYFFPVTAVLPSILCFLVGGVGRLRRMICLSSRWADSSLQLQQSYFILRSFLQRQGWIEPGRTRAPLGTLDRMKCNEVLWSSDIIVNPSAAAVVLEKAKWRL